MLDLFGNWKFEPSPIYPADSDIAVLIDFVYLHTKEC